MTENEINERFSALVSVVDNGLQSKMHEQALMIQASAKMLCPVRRYGSGGGSLRESIHVSTLEEGNRVISNIYTNSQYSVYVEFGTGPTGQANHKGIAPDANPVYSQTGWTMPADAMSPEDAEQYGFGIAEKDGKIIGYYTNGQAAQPFMYPALKENREEVINNIGTAVKAELKAVIK